jgi:hypothetical protein
VGRGATLALLGFAAGLAAVLSPAPAAAQAGGPPRAFLSGIEHEFFVPPNWEFIPVTKDNQVHFKPAQSLMQKGKREDFVCGMTVFEGQIGNDPLAAIKQVSEGQKKERPWMEVSDPKEMVFAGARGGLIVMVGNDPEKNGDSVAMVVAMAQLGPNVYLFLGQGFSDDIGALAGDMGLIINGVKPLSGGGGGGGGQLGGGALGGSRNRPAEPPRPGPSVSDPPWGLEVRELPNSWRLANEQGKYVFYAQNGATTVTVSHAWADAGYVKRLKGASKVTIGGNDAWQVEDKNAAGAKVVRYHVVAGEQATVFELGGTDLALAKDKIWPEFAGAVKIAKAAAPKRGGTRGVTVTLANGVGVNLGKPWSFEDFVASGATFKAADKGGVVFVQLRTAKVVGNEDPFTPQINKVKIQCQTDGGIYDEGTVDFGGAKSTYKLRCKPSPKADPKKAKKFRPMEIVVLEGKAVHVMLFARAGDDKASEAPDAVVEKFLDGVTLP